jgi:hypothetical protein
VDAMVDARTSVVGAEWTHSVLAMDAGVDLTPRRRRGVWRVWLGRSSFSWASIRRTALQCTMRCSQTDGSLNTGYALKNYVLNSMH